MKKIASLLLLVVGLSLFLIPTIAQDNSGDAVPIEFSGTVEAIDDTTITVSGLTVDISSLDSAVIAVLENGMEITISGNLDGTVVIAITVDLPDDIEPEATVAPDDDDNQGDDDDQDDDDDDTPTSDENGVSIQIFVSANGGTTWVSADNVVEVETDVELLVRFIVLNSSGFVLTGIDLSGTSFDISGCEIPTDLADGADFDCTVPLVFIGGGDGLALVVVLAGDLEGVVITISQDVNIQEDDDENEDDGVMIVIEGPVTAIEANQVTIFNFTIVIADDDPILTVIQIGDVLRIEGDWDDNQPIIVAIIVVFVNVDVYIFEGNVWRDAGGCNNAPPPWAPANGWRRRCQSNNNGGSGGSNRGGSGRGRGRSGRGSS